MSYFRYAFFRGNMWRFPKRGTVCGPGGIPEVLLPMVKKCDRAAVSSNPSTSNIELEAMEVHAVLDNSCSAKIEQ
jgi:hypothetical protein